MGAPEANNPAVASGREINRQCCAEHGDHIEQAKAVQDGDVLHLREAWLRVRFAVSIDHARHLAATAFSTTEAR